MRTPSPQDISEFAYDSLASKQWSQNMDASAYALHICCAFLLQEDLPTFPLPGRIPPILRDLSHFYLFCGARENHVFEYQP